MSVLALVLRESARRFPDRTAVVHGERALRYRELDTLTDELAAGLARTGIAPGDLVALALPASLEYVVAYLALARLHAVTCGVNPRAPASERAAMLERIEPAAVLADEDHADGVPSTTPTIPCTPAATVDAIWRDRRAERSVPRLEPDEIDPDAPETVVLTSGTTGVPKGAVFTSRQIAAITEIDTGGGWGHGGPQLVATGLPHVGFMTKLAGHLQAGSTLHLLTRWRAADALAIIARERIAYVGGVAAQISLLLAVPDFDDHDLGAVQGLIVGAGPSPPGLVREARRRFGAGYSIRYSSTESGGLGTLTAFDAPDVEALHTVGRPRPGTEVEIRSTDGNAADTPVRPGEVGQVCLRSPAVMDRYWRDPEATATALDADRWLRTGDLGVIDEQGCLRLTGRLSDMYIRGGYNVYPQEVESVLSDHPGVASVAVVGQPSAVMGEIGVAVVVAASNAHPPTLDELRAFADGRLAASKLPEAMRVVDALPLTSMDKVDRRALTELVAADPLPVDR